MNDRELLAWLEETDEDRVLGLFRRADAVRRASVGDAVHLRGLIEFSNCCVRECWYCGIRAPNARVTRYRMSRAEIVGAAELALRYGYGTVVLQSGEDPGIEAGWMADTIRAIKDRTALAVTLSLGERAEDDLALWRNAGADRYLLRFETSNPGLYRRIHPSRPGTISDRIRLIRTIRELGYEAGSGAMVGIPGQSYLDVAQDIALFRDLDLDMIGIGPYLPHPETPLGRGNGAPHGQQAPNTETMALKVLALTRLVCPLANLPSTTALATVNTEAGRRHGLACGANIIMPNVTPRQYRKLYEIYPSKASSRETPEETNAAVRATLESMGRPAGTGAGASLRYMARAAERNRHQPEKTP